MSKKTLVTVFMTIGLTIGGFIPWVFGDHSMLDGWSILGGLVGGIIGIWVGVKVGKQLG